MNPIAAFFLRVVLGAAGLVFMISLLIAAVLVAVFLLLRALLTGRRPAVFTIWQRARSTVRPSPWSSGGSARGRSADPGDVIDVEAREPDRRGDDPRLPPG